MQCNDYLEESILAMIASGAIKLRAHAWTFGMVDVTIINKVFTDKELELSLYEDDWEGGPSKAVAKDLAEAVRSGALVFVEPDDHAPAQPDRVEVDTPAGTIFAEVGGDKAFPEIYLGYVAKGQEELPERQVAILDFGQKQELDKACRLLVWGKDDDGDSYTDSFICRQLADEEEG